MVALHGLDMLKIHLNVIQIISSSRILRIHGRVSMVLQSNRKLSRLTLWSCCIRNIPRYSSKVDRPKPFINPLDVLETSEFQSFWGGTFPDGKHTSRLSLSYKDHDGHLPHRIGLRPPVTSHTTPFRFWFLFKQIDVMFRLQQRARMREGREVEQRYQPFRVRR